MGANVWVGDGRMDGGGDEGRMERVSSNKNMTKSWELTLLITLSHADTLSGRCTDKTVTFRNSNNKKV